MAPFPICIILMSISLNAAESSSSSALHLMRGSLKLPPQPPRISELVNSNEYKLEEYFVHTPDSYILRLLRLSLYTPSSYPRPPPVLLIHGLLDSCAAFLITGPKKALAFVLAEEGFDVWLGNVRGSSQSRNHSFLHPDDPATATKFWSFSFDDMAKFDLPSFLDKIEDLTLSPPGHGVSLIGHSQGSTIILAALASQPSLVSRINQVFLMAPVAFASHLKSTILLALVDIEGGISGLHLYELFGHEEFLPNDEILSIMASGMCSIRPKLCINMLAMIGGVSDIDESILGKIIAFSPSGTSVQNIIHWTQMIRERRPNVFSMQDFGRDCTARCNQRAYGQDEPPVYDLGSIKTKMNVISGSRDQLATQLDVELLREALAAAARFVEIDAFEHLDFTWSLHASERVYGLILDDLRKI